jgi:uncharacterized protein
LTPALIDAGPLVALFDPNSNGHTHYLSLLEEGRQRLRLHTTWPCVTEAAHFLSAPKRWAMLDWLGAGVITVFPFDQYDLPEMLPLMQRYTEHPRTDMDLADASLLWVALQGKIRTILTTDVRDFSRYRLPDGSGFEVL